MGEWTQPLVILMLTWLITWGSWITAKVFGGVSKKEWKEDKQLFYQKLDDLTKVTSQLSTNVAVLNERTDK